MFAPRPLGRRASLAAALALLLTTCAAALTACARTEEPARPRQEQRARLLIVGWDGASFRMIDRLRAEGRLPHLGALMERGAEGVLTSTVIPISSAAWTAAVTGKGPGHTGVYSFFEPVPGTYDVRLISSRSNHAPPLWRILTARGVPSLVFGVPITFPPEPVLGTLVAGMLSPFDATYAWPPERTDALRARGFEPDLDVWVEARPVSWEDMGRQLAIKREVLLEWLAADEWTFAMVVFKSLDVVSHLAYQADFHEHVGPVYDRLDAILGDLVAAVGPETNVIVMSDHGFDVYPAGFNLHGWLVEAGWSVLADGPREVELDFGAPLGTRERAGIRALREQLDWSRTRAWFVASEGHFGGIRLNQRGREPEGIVAPDERDGLLAELADGLLALRGDDGEPVVTRVWRGSELYPGPHDEVIPDLLLETVPTRQVFSDAGFLQPLGTYPTPIPDHDREGIFVAAGPGVASIPVRGRLDLTDVAPTALHLLGEPVHDEMTGAVRIELLSAARPVVSVPERGADLARRDPARPFTPEELRALGERLGRLGYGDSR